MRKYTRERTDPINKLDLSPAELKESENKSNVQSPPRQDSSGLGSELAGLNNTSDLKNQSIRCSFCQCKIRTEVLRPNWKWNLESNTYLCRDCYDKKANEFERRINFCNTCDIKLGFVRYNPKPKWKMIGQMCRKCWDSKNFSQ